MTILIPIMLFGWVPLSVILFLTLKPHHAVLFSVMGGWLFLPQIGYNLPSILPEYTKHTAISIGLLLGGRISGKRRLASFKWKLYDLPMILWCLCPIASSLSNELGLYDGASDSFTHIIIWGVPYISGRIYFNDNAKLHDLSLAIIIGGLLYVPLCLYEIRMSPQLSNIFYGFFPHSWVQHLRYGGYRPIVFMQHGLMVSLWMAISSVTAYWLWRNGEIKSFKGIPMLFFVIMLVITSILCKSVNGWFVLILGCSFYSLYRFSISNYFFLFMIMVVPLYILTRSTTIITDQNIITVSELFISDDRVRSLSERLFQEDLFKLTAMERPFFGWGGWGRGNPLDPITGERIKLTKDSLWIIALISKGYVGLTLLMAGLLMGPWLTIKNIRTIKETRLKYSKHTVLSLSVIFFTIDSLANGMINPIYIMVSGTLVGWHVHQNTKIDNHKLDNLA